MLFLCRHGETEWSVSGQHTGLTDLDLTARGKENAVYLRKRLEKESIDKVWTSPLKRARQTCEGLPSIVEPLALEWNYGDYEGLATWEIQQKNPDWNLFIDGAPNGETPMEDAHRADLLLRKIDPNENIALFSHGHFLRVLAARYLGLDPEDGSLFSLSTASLSILGHERGAPVIVLWNEVSYLPDLAK